MGKTNEGEICFGIACFLFFFFTTLRIIGICKMERFDSVLRRV